MDRPIRILITGGTIDDINKGEGTHKPDLTKTKIPDLLKRSHSFAPVVFDPLFHKDSRDIKESDRKLILERIKRSPENHIVITHGTYEIVNTARYLGPFVRNKTVVIMGSMAPYGKKDTVLRDNREVEIEDAQFNMGHAIASAQLLPHGVLVAMNGRIFPWHNVKEVQHPKWYFEHER